MRRRALSQHVAGGKKPANCAFLAALIVYSRRVRIAPQTARDPAATSLASTGGGEGMPRAGTTRGGTMSELDGKTIAFLATHMVEEAELVDPLRMLADAGAETVLISPEAGEIQS